MHPRCQWLQVYNAQACTPQSLNYTVGRYIEKDLGTQALAIEEGTLLVEEWGAEGLECYLALVGPKIWVGQEEIEVINYPPSCECDFVHQVAGPQA